MGFYLTGLLFYSLNIWLFHTHADALDFYQSLVFWLLPVIFILPCFAVGGLLYLLNHPRNFRFIFYGTLIGLLLLCLAIPALEIYGWYETKYLEQRKANEDFLNSNADYPQQQKQAFKILTDNYRNPNDLSLCGMSVCRYDSTIGGARTEVYDVGFEYYRRHRKGLYTSRCLIIGDRGDLRYFDRLMTAEALRQRDSSNGVGLKEAMKSILDDSVKLSLDSVTKEAFREKLKSD